jgi:hypothetical protein
MKKLKTFDKLLICNLIGAGASIYATDKSLSIENFKSAFGKHFFLATCVGFIGCSGGVIFAGFAKAFGASKIVQEGIKWFTTFNVPLLGISEINKPLNAECKPEDVERISNLKVIVVNSIIQTLIFKTDIFNPMCEKIHAELEQTTDLDSLEISTNLVSLS